MFKVKNQDLDGSSTRTYKTLAGALARFEEMVGWSMQHALADRYDGLVEPRIETIGRFSETGMFGNVVTFINDSPEPLKTRAAQPR